MARYLAVSGQLITGHDLYSLGLLTHIVELTPQESLGYALGHSFADDDEFKAVQSSGANAQSVKELLDVMNIYTPMENADELIEHEAWNQVMLVKPQQIPLESFFDDGVARKNRKEDLEGN